MTPITDDADESVVRGGGVWVVLRVGPPGPNAKCFPETLASQEPLPHRPQGWPRSCFIASVSSGAWKRYFIGGGITGAPRHRQGMVMFISPFPDAQTYVKK